MTDCHICTRHRPNPDGDCSDSCRHPRADHGNVCGTCLGRMRRHLDLIVQAYLSPPPSGGSGVGSERPVPGGVLWLDYRQGAQLRATLRSWCQVMHEDMTTPLGCPEWPPETVPGMVAWLRQWLDRFICTHDAVADFAAEIGEYAAVARNLLGDTMPGQVVPCPGLVDPCGQRLRIDVHDPERRVTCRRCGTVWTSGRLLVHAEDGMADAEAISLVWGVPTRTLRHWAQTGEVRREHGLYSMSDVRARMRQGSRQTA